MTPTQTAQSIFPILSSNLLYLRSEKLVDRALSMRTG